ncbi:Hypothetical predicted protein, partial [Paramuricea clavata]
DRTKSRTTSPYFISAGASNGCMLQVLVLNPRICREKNGSGTCHELLAPALEHSKEESFLALTAIGYSARRWMRVLSHYASDTFVVFARRKRVVNVTNERKSLRTPLVKDKSVATLSKKVDQEGGGQVSILKFQENFLAKKYMSNISKKIRFKPDRVSIKLTWICSLKEENYLCNGRFSTGLQHFVGLKFDNQRAVICLKENGRQADLEAGTLYTIVLEKIPEKLLSQYYRWLREKQKEESMETLKDWISQEAEYQIQASEIKHGFRKIRAERVDGSGSGCGRGGRTFYGKPVDGGDKRVKKCQVCTEIHPIWKCTKYRDQSIEDKWKMAKKLGLCYRCLGDNHLGNACKWNRQCNIDGCNETHHYLLHRPRDPSKAPRNRICCFANSPSHFSFMSSTFDVGLERADHHELMYSMKEVVGEHGQPSARLCPLGWTAVGKVNEMTPDEKLAWTKQLTTLGDKAKFHIRFLAPFILLAKLMMQKAWVQGLSWDEHLPEEHRRTWKQWFEELIKLSLIKIPRCLRKSVEVGHIEIHTFSDASEKAYSAVVYIRHEYKDGDVSVRLVAAKTRLAPLKTISIPRLELMGAVIGLRLSKQVCTALELPVQDVTFWIDSTTVGFWICGQSRKYKTFVAHRIGEIHEETNPVQWKYVPTSSNPADHGTRGLTVTELKENELWWNGPEFLKESRDKWPEEKFAELNAQVFAEMKPERKGDAVCFNATQEDESEEEWRLKPSRFSKWYRLFLIKRLELGLSLVRVRAWVHRFIANCRKLKKERVSGELTANELQGVEEIIIREAQMEVYCQEITALKEKKSLPKRSSILNLTPIWKDCLLRSNTRLRYSEDLSEEIKYPIILPKRHPGLIRMTTRWSNDGRTKLGLKVLVLSKEDILVSSVGSNESRSSGSCNVFWTEMIYEPLGMSVLTRGIRSSDLTNLSESTYTYRLRGAEVYRMLKKRKPRTDIMENFRKTCYNSCYILLGLTSMQTDERFPLY